MDAGLALRRLNHATAKLREQKADHDRRQRYYDGDHDLPFAPEGVSLEYMELREQAPINWLPLAIGAPVQRCRVDGFRTGRGSATADLDSWIKVWQANRMDARQKIVYTQSMVHGRGIMSVTKDPKTADRPRVLVENVSRVWIEGDPEDPFKPLYAVKTIRVEDTTGPGIWLPNGTLYGALERAYVYDRTTWVRFERRGVGAAWGEPVDAGVHNFGTVPFVPFDVNLDADGVPHSALAELIPSSDAINTIRFNALLAMQFSAYRQRVFSGFDPVVRDESGNPVWRKNPDGSIMVDPSGNPVPVIRSIGRIGVDRALVFPGSETKVFDLAESNLKNYIEVLTEFLVQLFARAQVPPQYLLSRMANLSGDALAGAESTLSALVADLKASWGESAEQVMRLAAIARGEKEPDLGSEVIWADAEARSFGATIDAITKLIGQGFPREAAFEMLPGATPQKVQRWMTMASNERAALNKAVLDEVERDLADGEPDDGAAA